MNNSHLFSKLLLGEHVASLYENMRKQGYAKKDFSGLYAWLHSYNTAHTYFLLAIGMFTTDLLCRKLFPKINKWIMFFIDKASLKMNSRNGFHLKQGTQKTKSRFSASHG